MQNIRNFSIIAHIDHGKSTLADRLLEFTKTIPERSMREQVLDSMELERERGITIKMQPVRMCYAPAGGAEYVLNLIDTPGHIDFSYEVSRALTAVEGALLLVDATQGVQAQTLTTLEVARSLGRTIIPVINKVDLASARVEDARAELADLLSCDADDILAVSGKTGQGVSELLAAIVARIPSPKASEKTGSGPRALIFDFAYSNHRGIIVYARVFDGTLKAGDTLAFAASGRTFTAAEVGIFAPKEEPADSLVAGSIGYIVTGIKEPQIVRVGDTIVSARSPLPPLIGYREPQPVVWASLFPESQDDFDSLRQALLKLRLSDSSIVFEEESSAILGRGFRCGFLGMLHLEIIAERLHREFDQHLIITSPTIAYLVSACGEEPRRIYAPSQFPDNPTSVAEPWVRLEIITPPEYLGAVLQLSYEHEAVVGDTRAFSGGRTEIGMEMPLRELMRGYFDALKSVSSGFASFSYKLIGEKSGDVVRMDVLVADEVVPAFTRVIARQRALREGRELVEKLGTHIPQHMFEFKIQARVDGRIIASHHTKALRKDVTGYLYGGDVTRKRKLLEKQKKGKKKMKGLGTVNIPQDVFVKVMR